MVMNCLLHSIPESASSFPVRATPLTAAQSDWLAANQVVIADVLRPYGLSHGM